MLFIPSQTHPKLKGFYKAILPSNTPGAGLIYSGTNLLFAHYDGNVLAGFYAGNTNITGAYGHSGDNVAVGDYSLSSDILGYWNTAVGYYAMNKNYFGAQNTGIGAGALQNNTYGGQNTAVGFQALFSNDTAGQNTAIGYQALFSVTSSANNTALGSSALSADTSGYQNTAIGSQSMLANVNGTANTALGYASLYRMTGGQNNTAVGQSAMLSDTTGSACVGVGNNALAGNTTGFFNTAIGDNALASDNGGTRNTILGAEAMTAYSSANNNTAIGYEALVNSTGDGNIALGIQAGYQLTCGGNNIYIGNQGVSSENSTIRLGDPNVHAATYIAGVINGNGSGLTSLQATQLVGTVPSPQLGGLYGNAVSFTNGANNFAGYFYGNGGGLYSVPASAVSGTLPATQLSGTISSAQISGTYGNAVSFTSGGNNFNGTFNGNGAGLTNLSGTQITTGTVGDSHLSTNVALLNANQTFTGTNTFTGTSIFVGTNLNGLNASQLSGTVASAQISGSYNNAVSFTNGGNNFAGTFSGNGAGLTNLSVTVTNLPAGVLTNNSSSVVLNGAFSGNGTGLTNLNASQLTSGVISYAILPGFQAPYYDTVGGGTNNYIYSYFTTIGGGQHNVCAGMYEFIGGGSDNDIDAQGPQPEYAIIVGGYHNEIGAGDYSFIGGGAYNTCSGEYATVASGYANFAGGDYSTVSGGTNNGAYGPYATVSGGNGNTANGQYAAIPGGHANSAAGDFSFAGGNHASAPYQGDFVWADDNGGNFAATGINQFFVRAGGGVFFYSGSGSTGVQLAAGSGSWSSVSDRNAKENFQKVDAQSVLTAVAAMPMTTWNYKTQAKTIRHVGPMAQDFAAAFHVGENDTTISTVDEGGVALAAIQGLNQKLEETRAENAELKQRLATLEKIILNQK